jgi:hypothetical protein
MLLLTATNILPERNASFTWIACRCLLPWPISRMICGAEFGNEMSCLLTSFYTECVPIWNSSPVKNLTFQTGLCAYEIVRRQHCQLLRDEISDVQT